MNISTSFLTHLGPNTFGTDRRFPVVEVGDDVFFSCLELKVLDNQDLLSEGDIVILNSPMHLKKLKLKHVRGAIDCTYFGLKEVTGELVE